MSLGIKNDRAVRFAFSGVTFDSQLIEIVNNFLDSNFDIIFRTFGSAGVHGIMRIGNSIDYTLITKLTQALTGYNVALEVNYDCGYSFAWRGTPNILPNSWITRLNFVLSLPNKSYEKVDVKDEEGAE